MNPDVKTTCFANENLHPKMNQWNLLYCEIFSFYENMHRKYSDNLMQGQVKISLQNKLEIKQDF